MDETRVRGDGGVETRSNRGARTGTKTTNVGLSAVRDPSVVRELLVVGSLFAVLGGGAVLSAVAARVVGALGSFVGGFYAVGILVVTVLAGVVLAGAAGLRFAERLPDVPDWLPPALAVAIGVVGTGVVLFVTAVTTALLLGSPNFLLVVAVVVLGALGAGGAGAFTSGVHVAARRVL